MPIPAAPAGCSRSRRRSCGTSRPRSWCTRVASQVLIGKPSAWLDSGYQKGSCGMNRPEQRTIDVDVEGLDTRGRTLHGDAAVYNVESEDLGGCSAPARPALTRAASR